ncbi:hypothetical protein [Paenibacillus sp. GCM10027626]|uniref:hypothetical protein n=1 Tax=Paenibacillus sp. GCM10027626 TaxID=3273411 RepID=UPI00363A8759
MSKRATGVVFICIAAFLYGMRYVSAAIFGSNVTSWSAELFDSLLSYIGNGLLIWSIISLAAGVIYLLWAEQDKKQGKGRGGEQSQLIRQIKENWNKVD